VLWFCRPCSLHLWWVFLVLLKVFSYPFMRIEPSRSTCGTGREKTNFRWELIVYSAPNCATHLRAQRVARDKCLITRVFSPNKARMNKTDSVFTSGFHWQAALRPWSNTRWLANESGSSAGQEYRTPTLGSAIACADNSVPCTVAIVWAPVADALPATVVDRSAS
jgi:hypothetical protein